MSIALEEDLKRVKIPYPETEAFAERIDLHSNGTILRYGIAIQSKLRSLTDTAFSRLSENGSELVTELLKQLDAAISDFCMSAQRSEQSFFPFFRKEKRSKDLRQKYEVTCKTLERIEKELRNQQNALLVDIELLSQLYDRALEYAQELVAYIAAGEKVLQAAQTGELVELQQRAELSQTQEDILLYNDFVNNCNAFEERLANLRVAKTICTQTTAQILLVRDTNQRLVQTIQNNIENTLAAWTENVAIALALEHNDNASQAANINAVQIHNVELQEAIRQALSVQATEADARLEVKATLQTLQNELDNSD